jgi:hypothetical protein
MRGGRKAFADMCEREQLVPVNNQQRLSNYVSLRSKSGGSCLFAKSRVKALDRLKHSNQHEPF